VSPEEARPALDLALSALRQVLEIEGTVTLGGVGTFSDDGVSRLFEPDPLLIAAVSGDYAGLGPVAEPTPVAVPFLTSFPVVPATDASEVSAAPLADRTGEAERSPVEVPAEAEPIQPTPIGDAADFVAPVAAAAAFVDADETPDEIAEPVESPPVDAGEFHAAARDETIDADLAAAMAGVWAPAQAPPLSPLRPPGEDFAREVGPSDEDDQSTLAFEDAEYSFVTAPPTAADVAAEPVYSAPPPPPFAPAAPFAATATVTPPAAAYRSYDEQDGRGWKSLWLVVPLVAVIAAGLWFWTRRGAQDDSAPPRAEDVAAPAPATDAAGSHEMAAAGGAAGDSAVEDSDLPPESVGDAEPTAAPPTAGAPADRAPAVATTPARSDRPAADEAAAYRPAPIRRQPAPQPEPAPTRPVTTPNPATPPPPTRQAPAEPAPQGEAWGLRGGGTVDASAGGVTWILNSTTEGEARAQVERYRALGYRAEVLSAVVDGRRVYRVAVGQFANAAEAHAARTLLPDDAPADAWILRLGRTP
jgi:hypothetical protein